MSRQPAVSPYWSEGETSPLNQPVRQYNAIPSAPVLNTTDISHSGKTSLSVHKYCPKMAIKMLLTVMSVIAIFFFVIPKTTGQTGGNFGDYCNSTDGCNFNKHLLCRNISEDAVVERCGCNNDLYYNSTSNACTAPVGGKCNPLLSDGRDPINCTPRAACVDVPDFTQLGTCECIQGSINDTIFCKLGPNAEVCRDSSECYERGLLKCSFGTCICDKNNATHVNQEWNEALKTCVGLVGVTCTPTNGISTCVENASCNQGVCTCDADYEVTEERRCLKSLDKDCTTDEECLSGFCKNGTVEAPQAKCSCRDGQIASDGQCFIKADQSCRGDILDCIENASCSPGSFICLCNNGYSSTRSGECAASYGSSCVIDPQREICNSDDYLTCTNSSTGVTNCACMTNYIYSANANRCQGLYGSNCFIDRGNDCVASTVCNNSTTTTTCQCAPYLLPGIDKKCKVKYNDDCSVYECDDSKFESCSVAKNCTCMNESLYYEPLITNGLCVLKVGETCQNTLLGCGVNSVCDSEGTKVCTCSPNFYPNEDNRGCASRGNSGVRAGNIFSFVLVFLVCISSSAF